MHKKWERNRRKRGSFSAIIRCKVNGGNNEDWKLFIECPHLCNQSFDACSNGFRRCMELRFAVICPQHQNHRIQRCMGFQQHRQHRSTISVFPTNAVQVGWCVRTDPLPQHATRKAELPAVISTSSVWFHHIVFSFPADSHMCLSPQSKVSFSYRIPHLLPFSLPSIIP